MKGCNARQKQNNEVFGDVMPYTLLNGMFRMEELFQETDMALSRIIQCFFLALHSVSCISSVKYPVIMRNTDIIYQVCVQESNQCEHNRRHGFIEALKFT